MNTFRETNKNFKNIFANVCGLFESFLGEYQHSLNIVVNFSKVSIFFTGRREDTLKRAPFYMTHIICRCNSQSEVYITMKWIRGKFYLFKGMWKGQIPIKKMLQFISYWCFSYILTLSGLSSQSNVRHGGGDDIAPPRICLFMT